jgi:hypothetical protein
VASTAKLQQASVPQHRKLLSRYSKYRTAPQRRSARSRTRLSARRGIDPMPDISLAHLAAGLSHLGRWSYSGEMANAVKPHLRMAALGRRYELAARSTGADGLTRTALSIANAACFLFELTWKIVWGGLVFLPLWRAGKVSEAAATAGVNCLVVILFTPLIPWDYVFAKFVRARGAPWLPRKPIARAAKPNGLADFYYLTCNWLAA